MDLGPTSYGLAFVAGGLSTLSPCVLPILPILLASAVAAHRLGPYALAGGLTLSFTLVGMLIASLGSAVGLDQTTLRTAGALLLLAFGLILISPRLQERFALAASGVSGAGQGLLAKVTLDGLPGQFILGLLLGVVWSPCVGPTLGAAITLASQGRDLAQVTVLMALFGLGAGVPLASLGLLSRQATMRIRNRLLVAGKFGKQVLGGVMILLGGLILSGADKRFEAWVLDHAPGWLVQATTSI
jgi:cytochrome c-type biogenesis protein